MAANPAHSRSGLTRRSSTAPAASAGSPAAAGIAVFVVDGEVWAVVHQPLDEIPLGATHQRRHREEERHAEAMPTSETRVGRLRLIRWVTAMVN